jgi:hypothetical protein
MKSDFVTEHNFGFLDFTDLPLPHHLPSNWLKLFSSQTLSHNYTPTILKFSHSLLTYLPRKMEQTECSETSAYKIQTPGNYPEENIQQFWLSGVMLRRMRYEYDYTHGARTELTSGKQ